MASMPNLVSVLLCLLVSGVPLAGQEPADPGAGQTDPRVEAAMAWLAHLDAGEFERTWETASSRSRDLFPREAWISTLRTARSGLDDPGNREVLEAEEIPVPPGAPDGTYARVVVRTEFTSRTITETVSLVRSDEEVWQVFGYQVQ